MFRDDALPHGVTNNYCLIQIFLWIIINYYVIPDDAGEADLVVKQILL